MTTLSRPMLIKARVSRPGTGGRWICDLGAIQNPTSEHSRRTRRPILNSRNSTMPTAQVIRISKNREWWNEERAPASRAVIVRSKGTGKLLTVKQVAARMNCGIWLVYDLIRDGELDCQPVGKRGKRVPEDSLTAYLERRRLESGNRRGA